MARVRAYIAISVLAAACGGGGVTAPPAGPGTPAEAPVQARFVLHDFNHNTIQNALGGGCGVWKIDPTDTGSDCSFAVDTAAAFGPEGAGLRLAYRLNPATASQNGFWMQLRRLDLSDFDHLEFRLRGDAAAGFATRFKIEFKKHKTDTSAEVDKGSYVVEGITADWQLYRIPLARFTGLEANWNRIEELVIAFHARRADVLEGAYHIDEIALVRTGDRGPGIYDRVAIPRKKAWEAQQGDETAVARAIQGRLRGWPTVGLADPRSFPADDRAFLERIARDTWKGIHALTDREHGLPWDTVRFGPRGSPRLEESRLGDYTNITNIGLYFLSVVGAMELGFIDRTEAVRLSALTLDSLDRMETWKGFYYNYYDCTSLERSSHFVSFVDSAWLTAGLMVVRNALPDLKPRCDAIISRQDYRLFYDDVERHMNHGWYTHMNARAEYNYGVLFTEPRAGSLIAIGTGAVPEEHWWSMLRTFPAEDAWQSLEPVGRREKVVRGHRVIGGWYEWEGMKYVPSWGGSLFEALMPTMVIDERAWSPTSLGPNGLAHITVHRRFALEKLRYPVWGMSPSSKPREDNYGEYGVRVLGTKGYHEDAVTPHVTGLAAAYAPREAAANFRALLRRYDIYGEYGFYDAVDPTTGQVAYKYLALDQEMLFLGLVNHLSGGAIWKHFAEDPIARKALPLLAAENFFE